MAWFSVLSWLLLCFHAGQTVKLTRLSGQHSIAIQQILEDQSLNVTRIRRSDYVSNGIVMSEFAMIMVCFANPKCIAKSSIQDGYLYFTGWGPLPGKITHICRKKYKSIIQKNE